MDLCLGDFNETMSVNEKAGNKLGCLQYMASFPAMTIFRTYADSTRPDCLVSSCRGLLTSNALFFAHFDKSPCSRCRASFTESGLESIDEPQCKPDVTPGVVIGRNIVFITEPLLTIPAAGRDGRDAT